MDVARRTETPGTLPAPPRTAGAYAVDAADGIAGETAGGRTGSVTSRLPGGLPGALAEDVTNGMGRPPAAVLAVTRATRLLAETAPARRRVLHHPVYPMLANPEDIRVFMAHHVFAVWDFMSLLTVLQRHLTCVDVPWTPHGSPEARRLVNDIVLTEESDLTSLGPRSHFELYLEAMAAAGADTAPVLCFLDLLADGIAVPEAVHLCGAPPGAAEFVAHTWRIVEHAPVHCVAAAFALGREELVPRMFEHVLDAPRQGVPDATEPPADFGLFREYLQRHIEVDGDEHGPMALRLLEELCGFQPRRWRECAGTVTVALHARAALWDAVADAVRERHATAHRPYQPPGITPGI